MPFPDYLAARPKIIMFSDFDGTITFRDSNYFLIDNVGCGNEMAKNMNNEVLEGRMSFGEAFKKLLDSIRTPYDECIKLLLENIELDPGFSTFYRWAKDNGVPVVILSGGMTPMIRALLSKLVGPDADDIELVCNDLIARDGLNINDRGGWQIKYRDNTAHGHDKSLFIKPYAEHASTALPEERPVLLYAGDGVSDLHAAKETDLLFAKAGEDLATYCTRQGVKFVPFENWHKILTVTQQI